MTIHLIGQAPSGAVYRLRHAMVSVTGGGTTRIWNTEDNPDQTSLTDEVAVGNYTVSVAPGWDLERVEGTTATPVVAQLISDNPAGFTVAVHQRTTVPLRFHVDTEEVDLAQGYEIVVTVEEPSPQLMIVTNANNFQSGSITVFAGNANGDAAPLRTIAGPLTTLEFPQGVTVANDQIVVCDSGTIAFFPLLANGDVAPARQIVGDETDIGGACNDVAVANGEIYVANFSDLLVFPVTANGDAAPSRRIRGFSQAEFIAVDHDELYVSDWNAGKVFVFSLPLAEDATPTRFLSTPCPSGLAVQDGELVVSDGCLPGIRVYPAAASGDVAPLRILSGPRSQIGGPGQVKRFHGELYLSDIEDRILIFPDDASGDVAPTRLVSGPQTGVVTPLGVAVH